MDLKRFGLVTREEIAGTATFCNSGQLLAGLSSSLLTHYRGRRPCACHSLNHMSNPHASCSSSSRISEIPSFRCIEIKDIFSTLLSQSDAIVSRLLGEHGLSVTPTDRETRLRSLALHFATGECYTELSFDGCMEQRLRNSDCRAHMKLLYDDLLNSESDDDRPMAHLYCEVLGIVSVHHDRGTILDSPKVSLGLFINSFLASEDSVDILHKIEGYRMADLYSLLAAHRAPFRRRARLDELKQTLIKHIATHNCLTSSSADHRPKCLSATGQNIRLLTNALQKQVHLRGLNRLLDALDLHLEIEAPATLNKTRRVIKNYIRKASKQDSSPTDVMIVREEARKRREESILNWPKLPDSTVRLRLQKAFVEATSSESLRESPCAVCGASFVRQDMRPESICIDDIMEELSLLRLNLDVPPGVKLMYQRKDCLDGLAVYSPAVHSTESSKISMDMCCTCHKSLIERKELPALAIANGLYLGSVPPELQELTVIEEALIARRRAKMWVVHLRGDGKDNDETTSETEGSRSFKLDGTEQKGMRGHVVVFGADPKHLISKLPPPLTCESVPVCVVFVGDKTPSKEWLLNKAKPLIIRTEIVRGALVWLKANNPLYSDIVIDHELMNDWPKTDHLFPAPVELQSPSHENTNEASRYDLSGCNECGAQKPEECRCEVSNYPEYFRNIVVSDIEVSTSTSAQMRTAAMRHLKSGKNFIQMGHSEDFINTYDDELLFPLLYPTLFPYGCGGFELSTRSKSLTLQTQARHFLSLADKRFQLHYSFLFTVFNILQRRAVNIGARLKVKQENFEKFSHDFSNITEKEIDEALAYHESRNSPNTRKAYTDAVKKVDSILKQVQLVSAKVQGTTGSRLKMRNEIRGMMLDLGLPSFYVTINPADCHNPIVNLMAGDDVDIDNLLKEERVGYRDQAFRIARNPFVGAKFFDTYMHAFFTHLIGDNWENGNELGGLLGHATGYYGCVEAQGRGSLHCHLLIWLDGALDPEEIKQRVLDQKDESFRDRLCNFLDEVIHNGIPEFEDDPPIDGLDSETYHAASTRPKLDLSENVRKRDLGNVVKCSQTHSHRNTCYKYDNESCRFDLDPSYFVPFTSMNPETGEMVYRILNGMINNYNPDMIEVLRNNMDIKFIGSGVSAKGILYYITDYITKSPLKMDAAYAALQRAIKALEAGTPDKSNSSLENARIVLIKCANQMISKQQLSAPQVASYLMGYGDCYTNHTFRSLYWPAFDGFLTQHEKAVNVDKPAEQEEKDRSEANNEIEREPDDLDMDDALPDEVLIGKDDDESLIPIASQCADYLYRNEQLSAVNLWDFISWYEKKGLKAIKKGASLAFDIAYNAEFDPDSEDSEIEIVKSSTSKDPSIFFFDPKHSQYKSHALHKRTKKFTPVPIGPGLPRRDRPDIEQKYARVCLLLFHPWRTLRDLKSPSESWTDALNRFLSNASAAVLKKIENIQRLHECKDSRDIQYEQRRLKLRGHVVEGQSAAESGHFEDEIDIDLGHIAEHLRTVELLQVRANSTNAYNVQTVLASANEAGLFRRVDGEAPPTHEQPNFDHMQSAQVKEQEARWRQDYQSRSQTTFIPDEELETVEELANKPPSLPKFASIKDFLPSSENVTMASVAPSAEDIDGHDLIKKVTLERTLNEEQARAFKLVAEASFLPRSEPLRMFMGGPGGTGKSTVLTALMDFFDARKQSHRLKKGAMTGNAARHIRGSTLHSMLCLGNYKKKKSEAPWDSSPSIKEKMRKTWKDADFLFVDEISLVGCSVLEKISAALQVAKSCDKPFGGINIIFAGDFHQLAPVADTSLYSQASLKASKASKGLNKRKLEAASGRLLWLEINECIIFHRQMRQTGDLNGPFRELLDRLRNGACTQQDYHLLQGRILSRNAGSYEQYRNLPILTSHNSVKDVLNLRLSKKFAEDNKITYQEYASRDTFAGKPIQDAQMVALLENLHTGKTGQLMKKLPLIEGMPVSVNQNYDVASGIVNGTDGYLKRVHYSISSDGSRTATSAVITVPGYDGPEMEGLEANEIVVFPETRSIDLHIPASAGYSRTRISVKRTQLPIQPSFAMTEFKAQGKTLPGAIIDLVDCVGSQAPYVMLSRVTNLQNLFILRSFGHSKIRCHLSEDLRIEDLRLEELALHTEINLSMGESKRESRERLEGVKKRRADLEEQRTERLAKRPKLERNDLLRDQAKRKAEILRTIAEEGPRLEGELAI